MEDLKEEYKHVLNDTLQERCLKGPPMKIHLEENAIPKPILTTGQIPVHQRATADALVNKLLEDGIIVPVITPTEWISRAP